MEIRNAAFAFGPGLVLRLLVLVAFAGLAAFYLGFEQNMLVHETLHDLRHAAGFPCH